VFTNGTTSGAIPLMLEHGYRRWGKYTYLAPRMFWKEIKKKDMYQKLKSPLHPRGVRALEHHLCGAQGPSLTGEASFNAAVKGLTQPHYHRLLKR
jgi:hypothetical protein